jgi:predicted acyl esterase
MAEVGLAGGIFSAGGVPFGLPLDQRVDEGGSLVHTSAPLSAPLEIAGQPHLEVRVAADASVAVLVAKLCDVAPDGTSALVTRGILNLTHRVSHGQPREVIPGHTEEVELDLDCTAWRFAAGHRVRLDLAACDWPTVWPTPAPAPLRLALSGCRIELMALSSPTLPPPRFADPPDLPAVADVQPEPLRHEVVHDHMDQSIRVRGRIGRQITLPWGTTVREWREMESVLSMGDSARAMSTGTGFIAIALRHRAGEAVVRTALTVQSDPAAFEVRLALEVDRDGQPFFERTWEERIPRQLL